MELDYFVQSDDEGQRAVDVLTHRTGMSRLLCKRVRLYGTLLRNGQPHRMIDPVCAGDCLLVRYHPKGVQPIVLRSVPHVPVRFSDEWIHVVSKPAGMVTHPTYLHDQDALTAMLSDQPLHPVNRLDKDTTGLVCIALNGHAHHVISSGLWIKQYVALLHGQLPSRNGLIHAPIRRAEVSLLQREIHPLGAQARTLWTVLRYFPSCDISFVRFQLITGRTHQLRLHSRAIGCPIVGDTLYGLALGSCELDHTIRRQALHASKMIFTHPVEKRNICVTAPVPPDFSRSLNYLFSRSRGDRTFDRN